MDMFKFWESGDWLPHLEDELRTGKGIFEMSKQITARQAFQAQVGGESTKVLHQCRHWHTYRRYITMKEVAEMEKNVCPKCEKQQKKDITLIEIAHEEEESLLVHTECLGKHEAVLDIESGALLLDNGKHQLVLSAQEAYLLLEFLYQHRDALDEAMHASVE